jgi:hypothetical protein
MLLQNVAQRNKLKLLYPSKERFHQKREGKIDEHDAAMLL